MKKGKVVEYSAARVRTDLQCVNDALCVYVLFLFFIVPFQDERRELSQTPLQLDGFESNAKVFKTLFEFEGQVNFTQ